MFFFWVRKVGQMVSWYLGWNSGCQSQLLLDNARAYIPSGEVMMRSLCWSCPATMFRHGQRHTLGRSVGGTGGIG